MNPAPKTTAGADHPCGPKRSRNHPAAAEHRASSWCSAAAPESSVLDHRGRRAASRSSAEGLQQQRALPNCIPQRRRPSTSRGRFSSCCVEIISGGAGRLAGSKEETCDMRVALAGLAHSRWPWASPLRVHADPAHDLQDAAAPPRGRRSDRAAAAGRLGDYLGYLVVALWAGACACGRRWRYVPDSARSPSRPCDVADAGFVAWRRCAPRRRGERLGAGATSSWCLERLMPLGRPILPAAVRGRRHRVAVRDSSASCYVGPRAIVERLAAARVPRSP